MPGVSKEPEGPRDYNEDPFCSYYLVKLEENPKNHKKKQHFLTIFVEFEGIFQFIQFWLNISAKTDLGVEPEVLLVLLTPLAPLGLVK